jgi:hypothetical protein
MKTIEEQITKDVEQETRQATEALNNFLNGRYDDKVVLSLIDCSGLKQIWAIVFSKVEDEDLLIDIDNAVRGL